MAVQAWVRELVESVCKTSLKVGATVKHPDGRTVRIIDGRFWGEHGVSNFWFWREVKPDGSLSRKKECGYGW